jgi:hypothetical protein
MQDEQLEQPWRDAARAYHEPPALDEAARDDMWSAIEAEHFAAPVRRRFTVPRWAGLAAAIVVGIALGRFTPLDGWLHPAPAAPTATVATAPADASKQHDKLPVPAVYEPTTSEYLGQTTALLIALPSEMKTGRADNQFIDRAQNLLLTTRLLLDSPAAHDAKLRGLLDDLEVVLAQIVQLQSEQNTADLDLITQALEQRDVLPRLRTAAADISAD